MFRCGFLRQFESHHNELYNLGHPFRELMGALGKAGKEVSSVTHIAVVINLEACHVLVKEACLGMIGEQTLFQNTLNWRERIQCARPVAKERHIVYNVASLSGRNLKLRGNAHGLRGE